MSTENANVVEIRGLVKDYGVFRAIDHLDLTIRQGEIFGLLGPNGSGKSTTIGCLLSLLKYSGGTIKVFGESMSPAAYDLKRRIGVVFQDMAVFDQLTVKDNIDYFCGLYVTDKTARKKYVEEAIDFVGLGDFIRKKPRQLSGGLKRRLNIACGIAHKPDLAILDEPTVAVDPQSRNNILEGIRQLNQAGSTIIYTSHYMEEVEELCTRIAIIDRGKLIAEGTSSELIGRIQADETVTAEGIQLTEDQVRQLEQMPIVLSAVYNGGILKLQLRGSGAGLMTILRYLEQERIRFGRIYSEKPTLNDVFLELTGKELRD